MEIEKKFLVRYIPENLEQYEKKVIEQGYLCKGPVVRIRKSNEDYILTYKNKNNIPKELDAMARVCQEVELPLTKESYEHLKEKVDGYLVSKTRYLIPLAEGRTAELDIFEQQLSGLAIVEVEFPDADAIHSFIAPEWFGEEVSQDNRYTNSYLSNLKQYIC